MKFISPQSWFYIQLPEGWHEFEDTENSFLFYHPERWQGNFRISAFQDQSLNYVNKALQDELKSIKGARQVRIGEWECIASQETFEEEGARYITYYWLTGKGNMLI